MKDSHPERAPVAAIADALASRLGPAPPLAVVLGSGLGPVVARAGGGQAVSAVEVGLPSSTVPGHAGRLVLGALGGVPLVLCSGRVHFYEGHSMATVVRCIRALHQWGVKGVLLTCSVGSARPEIRPGQLVLLSDHINFMGDTPLSGRPFGPVRFPDLSEPYHGGMREALRSAASEANVSLVDGILAAMMGPSYETAAEVRMVGRMGGDLVGMSTVPEALAAAELGMPVVAIAAVSNMGTGLADQPLSHDEVTELGAQTALALSDVLEIAAPRMLAAIMPR